ncbi:unnamed protein product [Boreogadus saida]
MPWLKEPPGTGHRACSRKSVVRSPVEKRRIAAGEVFLNKNAMCRKQLQHPALLRKELLLLMFQRRTAIRANPSPPNMVKGKEESSGPGQSSITTLQTHHSMVP